MPMRVLLLFLSICLVSGCSSTRAPTFTIQSADLTERTSDGMVVTFTILADNPNPDQLPLRDAHYEVTIDGKTVFAGTRSAQATVRRFGTQTFTLPAAIPLASGETPDGTKPFAIAGKVMYLVPGALAETLFDIHFLRPSTELRGHGVVDLSTIKSPAPTEITGPGAKPSVPPPTDSPGPSPD